MNEDAITYLPDPTQDPLVLDPELQRQLGDYTVKRPLAAAIHRDRVAQYVREELGREDVSMQFLFEDLDFHRDNSRQDYVFLHDLHAFDLDLCVLEEGAEQNEEIQGAQETADAHEAVYALEVEIAEGPINVSYARPTCVDKAKGIYTLDDIVVVDEEFMQEHDAVDEGDPFTRYRNAGVIGYKATIVGEGKRVALVPYDVVERIDDRVAVSEDDNVAFGLVHIYSVFTYMIDVPRPAKLGLPVIEIHGEQYFPQIEVDGLIAKIQGGEGELRASKLQRRRKKRWDFRDPRSTTLQLDLTYNVVPVTSDEVEGKEGVYEVCKVLLVDYKYVEANIKREGGWSSGRSGQIVRQMETDGVASYVGKFASRRRVAVVPWKDVKNIRTDMRGDGKKITSLRLVAADELGKYASVEIPEEIEIPSLTIDGKVYHPKDEVDAYIVGIVAAQEAERQRSADAAATAAVTHQREQEVRNAARGIKGSLGQLKEKEVGERSQATRTTGRKKEAVPLRYTLTPVAGEDGIYTIDDVVIVDKSFVEQRHTDQKNYRGWSSREVKKIVDADCLAYIARYTGPSRTKKALVPYDVTNRVRPHLDVLREDRTQLHLVAFDALLDYLCDVALPADHRLATVEVQGETYFVRSEVDGLVGRIRDNTKRKQRKPTKSVTPKKGRTRQDIERAGATGIKRTTRGFDPYLVRPRIDTRHFLDKPRPAEDLSDLGTIVDVKQKEERVYVENPEKRAALEAALGRIGREYRDIFERRYVDHLSLDELAENIGIPYEKALVRLAVARAHFCATNPELRRYVYGKDDFLGTPTQSMEKAAEVAKALDNDDEDEEYTGVWLGGRAIPLPTTDAGKMYRRTWREETIEKRLELSKGIFAYRDVEKLSSADQILLGAILNGDSSVDFLLTRDSIDVAAMYVHALYERMTAGGVAWPLNDTEIQQGGNNFVADYERLIGRDVVGSVDGDFAERKNALTALLRAHPQVARGYIAQVGYLLGNKDPQWTSSPWWKIAWKNLLHHEGIKHSTGKSRKKKLGEVVTLYDNAFREVLAQDHVRNALLCGYAEIQQFSLLARDTFVATHAKVAHGTARKYDFLPISGDEAFQEAHVGVMAATRRYDAMFYSQGYRVTFNRYARWWARASLTRAVTRNYGLNISSARLEQLRNMRKLAADMTQRMGGPPSDEELKEALEERLGWTDESIEKCFATQKLLYTKSLDEEIDDEGKSRSGHDIVADDMVVAPDVQLISHESITRMGDAMDHVNLTRRQRYILERRFFHLEEIRPSLKVVAQELDLSRERIRQVERVGIGRLEAELNAYDATIGSDDDALAACEQGRKVRDSRVKITRAQVQRAKKQTPRTKRPAEQVAIEYSVTAVDKAKGMYTLDDIVLVNRKFLKQRIKISYQGAVYVSKKLITRGFLSYKRHYRRYRPNVQQILVPYHLAEEIHKNICVFETDKKGFGLVAAASLDDYIAALEVDTSIDVPKDHKLPEVVVNDVAYHPQVEVDAMIAHFSRSREARASSQQRRTRRKGATVLPDKVPEHIPIGYQRRDARERANAKRRDVREVRNEDDKNRNDVDSVSDLALYGAEGLGRHIDEHMAALSEEQLADAWLTGDHQTELDDMVRTAEAKMEEILPEHNEKKGYGSVAFRARSVDAEDPIVREDDKSIKDKDYKEERYHAERVITEVGNGVHGRKEGEKHTYDSSLPERIFNGEDTFASVDALRDALHVTYWAVAPITQIRRKCTQHDLAQIITGDGTVEFLVHAAPEVAHSYAQILYQRAGRVEQQKEELAEAQAAGKRLDEKVEIGIGHLWPLLYVAKGRDARKNSIDIVDDLLASWEKYEQDNTQSLIALFKANPWLSRGYTAVIGHYLGWKEGLEHIGPAFHWSKKQLADVIDKYLIEKEGWGKKSGKPKPTYTIASVGADGPFLLSSDISRTIRHLRHDEDLHGRLKKGYMQMLAHAHVARNLLVERNEGLAGSRAKKYYHTLGKAVAFGAAEDALFRSAVAFDYLWGTTFATYAINWVNQALSRTYHNQSSIIRVPVYVREQMNKIRKATKILEQQGFDITDESLAAELGWEEEQVTEIRGYQRSMHTKSLDDFVGFDSDTRLHEFIADEHTVAVDDQIHAKSRTDKIYQLFGEVGMKQREGEVLAMRFGLGESRTYTPQGKLLSDSKAADRRQWERMYKYMDPDGMSLEQVGTFFDLSRERIRQVEEVALRKLRRVGAGSRTLDGLLMGAKSSHVKKEPIMFSRRPTALAPSKEREGEKPRGPMYEPRATAPVSMCTPIVTLPQDRASLLQTKLYYRVFQEHTKEARAAAITEATVIDYANILPWKQREAVLGKYLRDEPNTITAKVIGVQRAAVSRTRRYGIQKIKKDLLAAMQNPEKLDAIVRGDYVDPFGHHFVAEERRQYGRLVELLQSSDRGERLYHAVFGDFTSAAKHAGIGTSDIIKALDGIDGRKRSYIAQHIADGVSLEQLADEGGLSSSTMRSTVRVGLMQVQQTFEDGDTFTTDTEIYTPLFRAIFEDNPIAARKAGITEEEVRAEVAKLTDYQQVALELFYTFGFEEKDSANRLGVGDGGFRMRRHKGRDNLRNHFADRYDPTIVDMNPFVEHVARGNGIGPLRKALFSDGVPEGVTDDAILEGTTILPPRQRNILWDYIIRGDSGIAVAARHNMVPESTFREKTAGVGALRALLGAMGESEE